MTTLLHLLHHAATLRNTLLAGALWIVFTAGIMPQAQAEIERAASGPSIPDLRFSYTPAVLYDLLDGMGPSGRRMYLMAELSADVFYPIVRELFFALLLLHLQRRISGGFFALPWLPLWPLVTLALDFFENAALVVITQNYPLKMNGLAQFASVMTTLKWCASGLTVAALLFSLTGWFLQRKQKANA